MMTQEEQRIAIAEACEWTKIGHRLDKDGGTYGEHPSHGHYQTIPDYLNDLNAMHEAEKILTSLQQRDYLRNLYQTAVETPANVAGISTDVLCNEDEMFIVANATATQRAEAFCRTLFPERW